MIGAVAYNLHESSFEAGASIAQGLMRQYGGQAMSVVALFPTIAHSLQELLKGVRSHLPHVPVVGCSAYGNITSLGVDESTFSVSAIGFSSELDAYPFVVEAQSGGSRATGRRLGEVLRSVGIQGAANRLLFLFPDAYSTNTTDLYAGLHEVLPFHVDIVGGLASNDYQVPATYQFLNEQIITGGCSGFLLAGDFRCRIAISHGSRRIGRRRNITRSNRNVIYEINSTPALSLLRECIGSEGLGDYGQLNNVIGLGFPFEGAGYSEDMLLRAVAAFDEEAGSIALTTDAEENAPIYFTIRDRAKVATETIAMTDQLLANMRNPEDALYIYFNCDGRASYLYGDPATDVSNMRSALGQDKIFGGFWTFGELAPFHGMNLLHNFTGVLVGLEATPAGDSDAGVRTLPMYQPTATGSRIGRLGRDAAEQPMGGDVRAQTASPAQTSEQLQQVIDALTAEIFSNDADRIKDTLEIRKLRKQLSLLRRLYERVHAEADPLSIYRMVTRYLGERLGFDHVALLVMMNGAFKVVASYGLDAMTLEAGLPRQHLLRVAEKMVGVIANDGQLEGTPLFRSDQLPLQSFIIVPFRPKTSTHHLLLIGNGKATTMRRPKFTEGDLLGFIALTGQISIALDHLENMRRMAMINQELREADERKNDFMATLAHELRNPLAALVTATQLLARDKDPRAAPQASALNVLDRQLRHLGRLVHDLLDFTRISQGRFEAEFSQFKVKEMLSMAVEIARPAMDAGKHELDVMLDPPSMVVNADFDRLAQAVANLLDNAAKYTPGGGKVQLRAVMESGRLVIAVKDSGVGFLESEAPHILNKFQRVKPSKGLGLGLTIVQTIADLHGGTLELHSEGPGKGSEFIIAIPIASTTSRPDAPTPEAHQS